MDDLRELFESTAELAAAADPGLVAEASDEDVERALSAFRAAAPA
jgi:hypothetical protein